MAVALVTATPFKQWNVTFSVAPEIDAPEGAPLLELSRAARLAIVAMVPPLGGIAVVTVTATGPPDVLEQAVLAVDCCPAETATRSAWRAELVTPSR